jgi:hypothetical protein
MKRIVLVMLAVVVVAALPAFAQNDELTQIVSEAIAGLQELDSYTIHADQTVNMQMDMTMGEQTLSIVNEFIATNDIQVQTTVDGYNLAGTLVQETHSNSAGREISYTLTFEVVAVDGDTYLRANDTSGVLSSILPEDWVNVTEDAGDNAMFASFVGDNLDQLTSVIFPIDATTVTSIEELDTAEVDGESVRVFAFQLHPDALISSGMFDSLLESFGTEQTEQMYAMFEGAEMMFVAYVGEADGILRQLDTSITITDAVLPAQGMELPLNMQVEGTTTFSNFNEPVTIEAPEVE